MQPSDPTLLGRFLLVRSKRHLRRCSKPLVHLFLYFFGHQPSTTICHSALSIALWVDLPIIWSTNVRQTRTRGWKFCTSLCPHLPTAWCETQKKNSYWPVLPSLLASRSLSGFIIKVKDYVLEIHWRKCQLYPKEYNNLKGFSFSQCSLDLYISILHHLLSTHL